MKKLLVLLFLITAVNCGASPYADPWLYENMLDYVINPDKFKDNVTNGIIKNNDPDVMISTFIENAYSVYKKEEQFTKEIEFCGSGCYKDKNSKSITTAYHKFFYIYAIAPEITHYLIQNPIEDENIEYIINNKTIKYTWVNKNHLIINAGSEIIEFKQVKNIIKINTNMKSLNKYRLQ